jgi:Flp pilus assembly pilin Flp
MNKNNHTLLAALIALSLIAGFTTYFVSPDLNKTVAQGEGEGVTTKFDSTSSRRY